MIFAIFSSQKGNLMKVREEKIMKKLFVLLTVFMLCFGAVSAKKINDDPEDGTVWWTLRQN